MLNLLWLIPLLPLAGFLLNLFLIRNERTAGIVAVGAVALSFLASLVAFIQLSGLEEPRRAHQTLWDWISVGNLQIPFGLLLDPLSAAMILLVTGVGLLIHIYSLGYMHDDSRQRRYFAYLNLFITMMLMLVMADNLLLLFLGWEGVGLCSFLLIGHWYERKGVPGAAMKAFVINRVGDAALLLAMAAIFAAFGVLNFYDITRNGQPTLTGFLSRIDEVRYTEIGTSGTGMLWTTAVSLLLLLAISGKSAQIPLFTWLPDAMAGPTPVSALIHAATMVTAGVYLMLRTYPLFSQTALDVAAWVGGLTALIAALAAITQNDIKRVLAYSTISQLGYMVAAVGTGLLSGALFHLLAHGVFKALLFLAAGSVIHGTHDTQDMRRMGGLRTAMPITYWTFLIGALSLAGVIPLAGFWSKDEIISHTWTSGALPIFLLLFATAILTAIYVGRQIGMVFFGEQRDRAYHAHESGRIMTTPLIILAIGTVIAGALNIPTIDTLAHWLEPVFQGLEKPEEIGPAQIALALGTTLVSALIVYLMARYYSFRSSLIKPGAKDPLYRYSGGIWEMLGDALYLDDLYQKGVVPLYRRVSAFLANVFDPQGIDGLLRAITMSVSEMAQGVRSMQTGYVRTYALMFIFGVLLIITAMVVR